jgi:hypothetical protein
MEEIILDIAEFINDNDGDSKNLDKEAIRILFNSISSKKINSDNIISQSIYLMKIVDTFKSISGVDKKKLVIFILNKVIDLNIISNIEEKEMLHSFINNILPNVIDMMIAIDKKEISIKLEKIKACCFKFC